MSTDVPPVRLSWDDIVDLGKQLASAVNASGFQPDAIVGIAIGGLVPATLLARALHVKDVTTITSRSYNEKDEQGELQISHVPRDLEGKRVLLVDEIADSGKTLGAVAAILREKTGLKDLKTAVLVTNTKNCTLPADFSVMNVDRWVDFPWDA